MKQFFSLLILNYLRYLAKLQLFKNKPLIIGITGSAGKTSTRNALAAALQDHFKIKVSYKANSESGLPLNILGLSLNNFSWQDWLRVICLAPLKLLIFWPDHKIYIAEMAIDSPDSPKNMSYLLSIFKPQIGIFLNAQPLHSYNFDTLTATQDLKKRSQELAKLIAHEKGKMIQTLPKNGAAILNQDDDNVWHFHQLTTAPVISFGKKQQALVKIKNCQQTLQGTVFTLEHQAQTLSITLKNQILPDNFAYSMAAVLACCVQLQLPLTKAIDSIEKNFVSPAGRSNLIKGIKQSYILDSSYNSSAAPLIDLLKLLNKLAKGRRLALLGDMRELGMETQHEHERVVPIIKNSCDEVVLVGPQMKKYVLPKLQAAQTNQKLKSKWFASAAEAGKYLINQLTPNDVLLVKGSQNEIFLEIAVEMLMAEPEKANQLLCRRGAFWDKKRAEWLAKVANQ